MIPTFKKDSLLACRSSLGDAVSAGGLGGGCAVLVQNDMSRLETPTAVALRGKKKEVTRPPPPSFVVAISSGQDEHLKTSIIILIISQHCQSAVFLPTPAHDSRAGVSNTRPPLTLASVGKKGSVSKPCPPFGEIHSIPCKHQPMSPTSLRKAKPEIEILALTSGWRAPTRRA